MTETTTQLDLPVTKRPALFPDPPTLPLEKVGFFGGPFHARTWNEFGYLIAVLPLSVISVGYIVTMLVLSTGLLVTGIGVGVLGGTVLSARSIGAFYRVLALSMLRAQIAPPTPFRRKKGFWNSIWSAISDGVGWRAIAFIVVQFPLTIVTLSLAVPLVVTSIGAMTHWIWGRYLPGVVDSDGVVHHGARFMRIYFIDTPMRNLALALFGVALYFVVAAIIRGLMHLHRTLAESLLGPTAASLRVVSLEQSRGRVVEDADSTLRRIERDLHDGTQARLVAIAMQLGEAKEQATLLGCPTDLIDLLEAAHTSTKETLVELRELATGIHPPALDNGLAVALETLAARSPLPVHLTIDAPGARPAKAIETIAYFCVTELLTNAIKHAQATLLDVQVEVHASTVRLEIRDDGVGGAVILVPDANGRHTGLVGLAERVRSVDGEFIITSPVGGPTVVVIILPLHV